MRCTEWFPCLEVGDSAALEAVLQPVDVGGDGGVLKVAFDQSPRQRLPICDVELPQPEEKQAGHYTHKHDDHHLRSERQRRQTSSK